MSDLQNLTPANTYKALLQIGDYTNGISGDTGANALQVSDGAGNNTSLALSTDRVGIGNTSPSAELDVSGNVVADEYALDQTGSSSSAVAIHAPDTNELAIRTNSAERVRIDSSGNFGIGTSSPDEKLTIFAAVKPVIRLVGTGNNAADTNFGEIQFYNRDGSGDGPNVAASIHAQSKSDVGAGGSLVFSTENSDAEGEGRSADPRMTIDANGNIGMGTISPSAPLEVSSTTGGVIMPRMTTSQRTAISASNGEMVYDTDLHKFYGYANGAWTALH